MWARGASSKMKACQQGESRQTDLDESREPPRSGPSEGWFTIRLRDDRTRIQFRRGQPFHPLFTERTSHRYWAPGLRVIIFGEGAKVDAGAAQLRPWAMVR